MVVVIILQCIHLSKTNKIRTVTTIIIIPLLGHLCVPALRLRAKCLTFIISFVKYRYSGSGSFAQGYNANKQGFHRLKNKTEQNKQNTLKLLHIGTLVFYLLNQVIVLWSHSKPLEKAERTNFLESGKVFCLLLLIKAQKYWGLSIGGLFCLFC